MSAAIEVSGLVKRFGSFAAVDGVDFSVERGAIFGLLGPNGAGKSTIIRILCGLLRASGGQARVAEVDVVKRPDQVKPRIGYMSQRFSLYRDLTVDQNIAFYGGVYGLDRQALRQRRDWALDVAGLTDRAAVLAGDLAGGYAQRLALVCALLHEPEVVFLDEPTGGVDPLMRRAFFALIEQLAAAGTTVLLTTHFLDEAEYCHRIALIARGKLIAQGTPTQLKQQLADRLLLEVRSDDPAAALAAARGIAGVDEVTLHGAGLHVFWQPGTTEAAASAALAQAFHAAQVPAGAAQPTTPSLEDVFISLARGVER
ncbi:MAG: ABC transporter ATP-binding protein [Deltaproteobacteria bacterium]|nr:ABC transporter ATP-binding protein [Deltaproteobacteria bacterium]